MPTPRPIDPYRPPKKTEEAEDQLASKRPYSGQKIAFIFFIPLIIAAASLGLGLMFKLDTMIALGFWLVLIAMIVVCVVIADHYAGDVENRGLRMLGFFLLVACAQIFVNTVALFGGCMFIFSAFY